MSRCWFSEQKGKNFLFDCDINDLGDFDDVDIRNEVSGLALRERNKEVDADDIGHVIGLLTNSSKNDFIKLFSKPIVIE